MRTSVNMPEKLFKNLEAVAATLGVEHDGKPSWRSMITKIAKGELVVSLPGKTLNQRGPAVAYVDHMPTVSAPKPDPFQIIASQYVSARDDGTVVDTSEFDSPAYPKKANHLPVPVPEIKVGPVPTFTNIEDKKAAAFAALASMGLKKGSELT